jgi:hypothetical protein
MKRKCDAAVSPHDCGFDVPGGLMPGQMSCRRSVRSMKYSERKIGSCATTGRTDASGLIRFSR